MKKTISIKLKPNSEQLKALSETQIEFSKGCNLIVPYAVKNRCWNRVALHHLTYNKVREQTNLGSQMVCNAINSVCSSYKILKIKKSQEVPTIKFKENSSVHYDKRTYSFKKGNLSLYTISGRIQAQYILGDFQRKYLEKGIPKEAELIHKRNQWYFNLVLDLPDTPKLEQKGKVLGIDLGENNIASTSSGKIFGGKNLCHQRDKFLALRSRLQSNGTKSSKQLLQKVSGKELRYTKQVNHEVSKAIIKEALDNSCDTITMEKLTNIRKRIKANKRVRSRLHRWSWFQLQTFIEYKAVDAGINVEYVNPAYTSKTCSKCGTLGIRKKHFFKCNVCKSKLHADLNASQNISKLSKSIDLGTGSVNFPNVAV